MKVRCQGCKDFKFKKQLPDYQVVFNNWCELYQSPCALIKHCNLYPDLLKKLPKPKTTRDSNELFHIFAKKTHSSPPFVK